MSNELVKGDHYMSELSFHKEIANIFVKTGKLGKDYNPETVILLLMYAKEIGLTPAQAVVNGFNIIQGKIEMKPMMMNAMIRRAGHSIQIQKWEIDECILKGVRKDNGDSMTLKFSIEDAKRAGLTSKSNWTANPKNMLFARAMGNLGRMLFADVIGNTYAEGEIDEVKSKNRKDPLEDIDEILVDTVEVMDAKPVEKVEDRVLTLIDLNQALASLGEDHDILELGKFVTYMAETYNKDDQVIIRSAMMSQEQLQRFQGHLKTWQETLGKAE